MRPIDRLRSSDGRKDSSRVVFSAGGTGAGWSLPAFWAGGGNREDIGSTFSGYVQGAYKANGVVFACILARMLVFAEVRFRFQNLDTGQLRRDPSLALLERPWPSGTTGDLLARMEQDGSLAGNSYVTRVEDKRNGDRLRRLRPDWVTTISTSDSGGDEYDEIDSRLVGYGYDPGGRGRSDRRVVIMADQMAHWTPNPDPECNWKGMSWLTPVVREIQADQAATRHKLKYFEHGTVGGMAVTYEKGVSPDAVKRFAELFAEQHSGVDNAYKTLHFGGGADVTTLGADLKQLDFKVTQGAGETRVASASGVGAIIAQLSEGMQGSSLNAGNYAAARRRFADGLLRPNWRSVASALETLFPAGPGERLTYDPSDVSFLQEDEKDAAEILGANAGTIAALTAAGFHADVVVAAVTAGDLRPLIGNHSGLFSVQLQSPTDSDPAKGNARQLSLVEMIQKLYLGVGVVITAEEGRAILNAGGANLTGPGPNPEGAA